MTDVFRRRCAALLLALIPALLCSGCSQSAGIYRNYRAIEDLQVVQTLGVDLEPDGRVTVTAAVAGAGDSTAPAILCRSAKSLPEALASMEDHTERGQLFFAHIQYLLLGQAMAEDELAQVFDYVERDIHTRMGTELFLIRNGSARELMAALADGEAVSALLAAVLRDTELHGDSHVSDLRTAAVALCEYGAATVCALHLTAAEDSILSDPPALTAVADGYGIFRDGRLCCFVSGEEAEALGLLTGTAGTVLRSVSDGEGGTVTLELRGSAEITAPAQGQVHAVLRLDAAVAALDTPGVRITEPDGLRRITDALAEDLNEAAVRVLSLSRTLDADFLPLAPAVRRGRSTDVLPEDWLQTVEFTVETQVVPTHSYDLGDPPESEARS